MVKKRIDNSLYQTLVSKIGNALPLEYAIRASEAHFPKVMNRLKQIDEEIRFLLSTWGADEQEIDALFLVDYAWDLLQIGSPRVRMHGCQMHNDIAAILDRCNAEIHKKLVVKTTDLALPAAQYFRVCDLLNGNNIEQLLYTTEQSLHVAEEFGPSNDIPASAFSSIAEIREPLHLHPGFKIGFDCTKSGELITWSFAQINSNFTKLDLDRQISEFTYQFAALREQHLPGNALSRDIFNHVLNNEIDGIQSEEKISRLDSISVALAGLYCRDLCKRENQKLTDAVEQTMEIYKKSDEMIRTAYKSANAKIKKYAKTFEPFELERIPIASGEEIE